MARTVRWTLSAADNLEAVCEYIAKDSPGYAADIAAGALALADSLQEFANRGRQVPESQREDIREVFLHRFRLIYRVEVELVQVLAFVHGARSLAPDEIIREAK